MFGSGSQELARCGPMHVHGAIVPGPPGLRRIRPPGRFCSGAKKAPRHGRDEGLCVSGTQTKAE
ncbi:hypothetical protein Pla123a_34160 [Posidoniimonas polymericola]|uniref:Uncharacterized protein n=1 Tax=Posidoniimonas polymericola TaxID=2528002 RepID=A0A5C5YI95_9BACT|nr:hypothetical protein Pla123a_34160 [Posidoniimonas polymericola]